MALYRYVQSEEKGKWVPLLVGKEFEQEVEQRGVVRSTVLAVSDIVEDDTPPHELGYIGPLYFDIDVGGNLNLAISSTQELVYKLRELEVPDEGIQVYASGSKGFHVFVPESVFLPSLRPVRQLPYIYMEMARDLYVMGLDFAVYSGGKGRMFRPDNGKRPDGKYRVRITLAELDEMTPEAYAALVRAPRDLSLPGPNGHKSTFLHALFERAKRRAHSKQILRGTSLPVEALQPYAEEPPGCVDLLTRYEVHKNTKFNLAGMQLAAFVARAGTPDYRAESLATMMAEHGESSTYNTPIKRKVHLMGLISYARAKPSLAFTCSAMRSVVSSKVCTDCPLNSKKLEDSTEIDEDGAILGVVAYPDGYYLKREKGSTRLSTFTLQPVEIYLDMPQGEGSVRRVSTRMEVYSKSHLIGTIMFDEAGWRSKAEFLKQLEGVPGIAFLASDLDVQRIKYAVFRHCGDDEVEEVVNVYSAGIHASTVGKKKVYTYVEPGLSINTYGVQGTHRLQGTLSTPPQIRLTAKPTPGDEKLQEALLSLLAVNSPVVVAHVLGWHCAAHLKAHISAAYKQFPLLNLWGAAGSGKTFTAALFSYLNGVDYRNGGSPLSCSTSTAFPIIETCSSTTTVPRLLEEFNQSQMRSWMFALVTDVLKAAWDGMAVPRGTLNRSRTDGTGRTGARTEALYITAPIVICSEQAPQKPALRQRSLQVHLTNLSRAGCAKAFNRALALRHHLLIFSRALTFMAIRTKDEWIADRYQAHEEVLGEEMYDRYRFSYATLLLGLDFFEAVAASLNLELGTAVDELRQALLTTATKGEAGSTASNIWSEVDTVMLGFSEMAQLALQNSALSPAVPGKNFLANAPAHELVLDLALMFPMYRKHARSMGETPVFNSLKQLEPLLESEPYFRGKRIVPSISGTRHLWVLDLRAMATKGHDISLWLGPT